MSVAQVVNNFISTRATGARATGILAGDSIRATGILAGDSIRATGIFAGAQLTVFLPLIK